MRHGYPKGTGVIWVIAWTFLIFLNTADCELLFHLCPSSQTKLSITVLMILRVYAMWNRSKWILYLLLFVFVPQVIVASVFAAVYNSSTYLSGMSWINFTRDSNLTQVSLNLLPPFSRSSHSCPSLGFLFLQYLIDKCAIRCFYVL